jgi:ribosomal protein S27AE
VNTERAKHDCCPDAVSFIERGNREWLLDCNLFSLVIKFCPWCGVNLDKRHRPPCGKCGLWMFHAKGCPNDDT